MSAESRTGLQDPLIIPGYSIYESSASERMSALNSDSAGLTLSRTESCIICRQKIFADKLKRPELIIKEADDTLNGGGFVDCLFVALIFITVVVVVVSIAKNIASHRFKCRHCSKEFHINWFRVIITEHSDSEYRLLCPFCKTKDWCTEQKKQ